MYLTSGGSVALRRHGDGRLLHSYGTFALMAVLCVTYLDIPSYAYALKASLLPKYFFYAFAIAVVPLLAAGSRSLGSYLVSPFVVWAFALVALDLAYLLGAIADDAAVASVIITRIEYVLLAVLLGFACWTSRPTRYQRIFPVVAVVIPVLAILDFLSPGVLYPLDTPGATLGRAAATFINPNRASEAMLVTFILAIPVLGRRYRAALLLLVSAGVIVTFSRAAILGLVLVWVYLVITKLVPRYTLAVPLAAVMSFSLLVGNFENYLNERQDLGEGLANIQGRLEFFEDRVLDDDSAAERAEALKAGIDLFRKNPIFGAGAGATDAPTFGAGTHNLAVMLGAEYGLAGIALWLWLVVVLLRGGYFRDRRLQGAMAVWFVFVSMFSHNVPDTPFWLLTFAIVSRQRQC